VEEPDKFQLFVNIRTAYDRCEIAGDARDVMVGDGKAQSDPRSGSGLLQIHSKDFRPVYEPSKRRLTWPNGAVASIYNATEPDQLRGPQHDAAWCDELAKWRYAKEAWDQLQFGLRTGTNRQVCITTTPRPIGLLKDIIKDPSTRVTGGSTIAAISRRSFCCMLSANTKVLG
jgi:phage terminase large subunit-like protein